MSQPTTDRFLQIMREAVRARQAGVSAPVALMASCDTDDDWNIIFERLLSAARMEQSFVRMERNQERQYGQGTGDLSEPQMGEMT